MELMCSCVICSNHHLGSYGEPLVGLDGKPIYECSCRLKKIRNKQTVWVTLELPEDLEKPIKEAEVSHEQEEKLRKILKVPAIKKKVTMKEWIVPFMKKNMINWQTNMKRPACVFAILDWEERWLEGLLTSNPTLLNDPTIDADNTHDPHDSIDEVEPEHEGVELFPDGEEPTVQ